MNLADHPNEAVATANDHEAQAFLAELGLLEKFQSEQIPRRAKSSLVIRLDHWDHPTHWITALKYEGFERPEDNGLAVRCQPKSRITFAQFKAQLEAEKKAQFPGGSTETIE